MSSMFKDILKLLSKDNLQVQALSECYEMMDICSQMVDASVESLRHKDDAQVSIDIYRMDKRLNSFERDVRRKVMTHLSLGHVSDLASGLSLVSIVVDMERIGDYSKNIYDLAVHHPGRLQGGEVEDQLTNIEKTALEVFRRTATTFKNGNIDEARDIMKEYKEDISGACRDLEEVLVGGGTSLPAHEAVAVALYTRFLKRISAHSRNLISSLVNPFDRLGYEE